jgi:hypothetical protein
MGSVRRIDGNMWDYSGWYVIPVNCVGVPGAGLAMDMARRYPRQTTAYIERCRAGKTILGRVALDWPLILFPTKYHWSDTSNPSYIIGGLNHLLTRFITEPINLPAIGCGLGKMPLETLNGLVKLYLFDDKDSVAKKYDWRLFFPDNAGNYDD